MTKQLISWLLWIGIGSRTTKAFIFKKQHRLFRSSSTKMSSLQLEIEEKFQLSDSQDLESKLKELGFVSVQKITFVDWYFDTKSYALSLQDCWLRYREKAGKEGNWELKRGRGQSTPSTVYEETKGKKAVSISLSLIPESCRTTITDCETDMQDQFVGFDIPKIDNNTQLYPFCRLETRRSSWEVHPRESSEHVFSGLAVDLDETNTGHSVGEVEIVVDDDRQVNDAKRRIRALVAKLTEGEDSHDGPAIGKLEHYLIYNRPDHYEACVHKGVIKDKTR